MVVLSDYPTKLYDNDLFAYWERHERRVVVDGARIRTEVVWLNKACADRPDLQRSQQSMFA